MKFYKLLTLGALLSASFVHADGLGFNIGPFSMQLDVDGSFYANDHRDVLDNPICFAISNQKRLDVIIEGGQKVSSNEIKFITKRLVIEPYAFGVTREGKPVLQGNVIEEKLIKEVTVKRGNEKTNDNSNNKDISDQKKGGFFTGWFKSDKSTNIDIQNLSNLHVISDSHFDAPKDYKGLKDDNIRVICELPIVNK